MMVKFEIFAYDQQVMDKMTGMSDEEVLEHFKEAYTPKMEDYVVVSW